MTPTLDFKGCNFLTAWLLFSGFYLWKPVFHHLIFLNIQLYSHATSYLLASANSLVIPTFHCVSWRANTCERNRSHIALISDIISNFVSTSGYGVVHERYCRHSDNHQMHHNVLELPWIHQWGRNKVKNLLIKQRWTCSETVVAQWLRHWVLGVN